MPTAFETVHTCVSIQNTNPLEVFSDSQKYFMIVYVSHPVCTNIRRLFSPKQNNF